MKVPISVPLRNIEEHAIACVTRYVSKGVRKIMEKSENRPFETRLATSTSGFLGAPQGNGVKWYSKEDFQLSRVRLYTISMLG